MDIEKGVSYAWIWASMIDPKKAVSKTLKPPSLWYCLSMTKTSAFGKDLTSRLAW